MLRYHDAHDVYPKTLRAVDLLDLTDPFSGDPLIYRPKSGGFVVSSVGENLNDDGGTPGDRPREGDLAWRLSR